MVTLADSPSLSMVPSRPTSAHLYDPTTPPGASLVALSRTSRGADWRRGGELSREREFSRESAARGAAWRRRRRGPRWCRSAARGKMAAAAAPLLTPGPSARREAAGGRGGGAGLGAGEAGSSAGQGPGRAGPRGAAPGRVWGEGRGRPRGSEGALRGL